MNVLETRQLQRSLQLQRVATWIGGPFCVAIFALGFWGIARFVPPPSPGLDAQQIAAIYAERPQQIRIGMMLTCTAGALMVLFFTAIYAQMKRIEGRSALLSPAQLVLGALFAFETIMPLMIVMALTFREGRDPATMLMLNDVVWIMWLGITYTGVLQWLIIAAAILSDPGEVPVFPRWLGYATIFVAADFVPLTFIVFFHDGPFAWTGLLTFWLSAAAWTCWIAMMTYALLQAISAQQADLERIQQVPISQELKSPVPPR